MRYSSSISGGVIRWPRSPPLSSRNRSARRSSMSANGSSCRATALPPGSASRMPSAFAQKHSSNTPLRKPNCGGSGRRAAGGMPGETQRELARTGRPSNQPQALHASMAVLVDDDIIVNRGTAMGGSGSRSSMAYPLRALPERDQVGEFGKRGDGVEPRIYVYDSSIEDVRIELDAALAEVLPPLK